MDMEAGGWATGAGGQKAAVVDRQDCLGSPKGREGISWPHGPLPKQVVSCFPQQGGAGPGARSQENKKQGILPAGLS